MQINEVYVHYKDIIGNNQVSLEVVFICVHFLILTAVGTILLLFIMIVCMCVCAHVCMRV